MRSSRENGSARVIIRGEPSPCVVRTTVTGSDSTRTGAGTGDAVRAGWETGEHATTLATAMRTGTRTGGLTMAEDFIPIANNLANHTRANGRPAHGHLLAHSLFRSVTA